MTIKPTFHVFSSQYQTRNKHLFTNRPVNVVFRNLLPKIPKLCPLLNANRGRRAPSILKKELKNSSPSKSRATRGSNLTLKKWSISIQSSNSRNYGLVMPLSNTARWLSCWISGLHPRALGWSVDSSLISTSTLDEAISGNTKLPDLPQGYAFKNAQTPVLKKLLSHSEPQPLSTSNYAIGCLLMHCIFRFYYIWIVFHVLSP